MTSWLGRLAIVGLCLVWALGPARAAPSPQMLLETVDLSSLAMAPDGRQVAFRQEQASVERNTYDTAWMVQAVDGASPPRRIADGGLPLRYEYGAAISEPPQWSPDGYWIYYRALLDGAVQVWRAAADGARAEAVTHDAADVEAFTLGADGRRLIYTVGATRAAIQSAEQDEDDGGVRIDASVPIGQGLVRSGWINGRLANQRWRGDWMERRGLLADAPRQQWVVDLATLTRRPAIPADQAALAGLQTFAADTADERVRSPTSGAVAYVEASGTRMTLHAEMRASAGSGGANEHVARHVACAAPACQGAVILALAWRPGHDEVLFTTSDRDRGRAQSLYDWDVAGGGVRLVASASGLIDGGRGGGLGEACAAGADVAVCVTAAADEPPRLERIDLQSGVRLTLYAPNAALSQAVGPRVQPLQWRDPQGQVFHGQYFPPADVAPGQRAALFITYYGCSGFLRGGVGDEWPLASLAGAGVAALCVDEPPIDLTHIDQLARYQTALGGVGAVIDLLDRRGLIDPTRVGMGGLSFGSEVTLWTAMNSDRLAAASVSSTAVTPTYYRLHALQGEAFLKTFRDLWGLGAPEATPDRWRQISPAFNTAKIHAPLLLQMPEQEYLPAMDYVAPLAASPTPTELYVFPNEPHQKIEPRHKLAVYQRNLDWFRFWLQGYVDPDPLKAAQYQRWTAMRTRAQARGSGNANGRPHPKQTG